MNKNNLKDRLLEAWDIAFILLLCFMVLIATMFASKMQGATEITGYHFGAGSFAIVVSLLAIYLGFMLFKSKQQLKEIVSLTYDKLDKQKEDKKND